MHPTVKDDDFVLLSKEPKTSGRACRYCKGTGVMKTITPNIWKQITQTEEYRSATRSQKSQIHERFVKSQPCTNCKTQEKLQWQEKINKYGNNEDQQNEGS